MNLSKPDNDIFILYIKNKHIYFSQCIILTPDKLIHNQQTKTILISIILTYSNVKCKLI